MTRPKTYIDIDINIYRVRGYSLETDRVSGVSG